MEAVAVVLGVVALVGLIVWLNRFSKRFPPPDKKDDGVGAVRRGIIKRNPGHPGKWLP